KPQAHHQRFAGAFFRPKRALLAQAVAIARNRVQPVLRLAVTGGRQRAAPAMGAGADADIVRIAPVSEIVPAPGAGRGVVRDFIGWPAGSGSTRLRQLVERGGMIEVGGDKVAEPHVGLEARSGLDGELIE